jgi:hypothetical protein
MTNKQKAFIDGLIDQIGYRNSPRRSLYLERVLRRCVNIEAASEVIERLLAEKQIRSNPPLKKFHTQHVAVTDLSAFTFCPASYAITETFEIQKSPQMLEGENLHKGKYLMDYLQILQKFRMAAIKH